LLVPVSMRRTPRDGPPAAVCALVLAAAVAGAAVPGPSREPARFQERLDVRELEVDFDASVLPPLESTGRRADEDFLVIENGIPLERIPTRASEGTAQETEADAREIVELLVWFDRDLAAPGTRAAGARALATAATAGALERCASIALRVDGVERSMPAADPTALAAELRRRARGWDSDPPEAPPLDTRLRALDRLSVHLARRAGGGRRALVVVGDAWPVDAQRLNALGALARAADAPGVERLRALEDAARLAAAFGWTPYVLAAVTPPTRPMRPGVSRSGEERIEAGGASSHRWWVRLFAPRHYLHSMAREAAHLEVSTDFGLRPWAHFVRAGAGTLLGDAAAVSSQLDRLASRRRLVVRSPEPGPGRLLPLEVRWSGGDGRPVPSRRWSRSGLPPEAAAARLRALAAGDLDLESGEPVRMAPAGTGPVARRLCFVPPGAHAFVRSATWSADADAAAIAIGPVLATGPGAAEACAPLPAPAHPGAAREPEPAYALIEDPESGEWGALRPATAP
jgi:hypothetical protein